MGGAIQPLLRYGALQWLPINKWLRPLCADCAADAESELPFEVCYADSDEAGHLFRSEGGHLFRREAGRRSEAKPAKDSDRDVGRRRRPCGSWGMNSGPGRWSASRERARPP